MRATGRLRFINFQIIKRTMKRIYSKPETDITVLNLQDSVLETIPAGDPSFRAGGEGFANTIDFDEGVTTETEPIAPKSLWD